MTKRDNIADIMVIGAQKAATSWLHHVLNAHPRTWAFPDNEPMTSTVKEAHFWDWNRHRGVDWYRDLMRPPEATRLTMDCTPEYSMLPERDIAECKALNPNARIIYVLRDPLARAVSALRMHLKWHSNSASADSERIDFDDRFITMLTQAKIHPMSDYVGNYARWSRHYRNILVLNYEDILAEPDETIARVYQHCGLDLGILSDDDQAEFDKRLRKRIWQSTYYPVTSEAVHFLHGLLWPRRKAAEKQFGFTFEEHMRVLAQVTGPQ